MDGRPWTEVHGWTFVDKSPWTDGSRQCNVEGHDVVEHL
jgi:hypothetical protein